MPVQVRIRLKVADEVWVATALLHSEHTRREDFAISEIVQRVQEEKLTPVVRPGVYVHILQHCVANRPPNPGRYRMLVETREGYRRLYRDGDSYHPAREGAKITPERGALPPQYEKLIDWYYAKHASRNQKKDEKDSILELRGLGKGLWKDEDPDSYIRRLREGWE